LATKNSAKAQLKKLGFLLFGFESINIQPCSGND
jgi:hypothetical protein